MNKKVGIITYHGLHNYGAMLQAYALQTVIDKLGYNCELINFRTNGQKRSYLPAYKAGKTLRDRVLNRLFLSPYKSDILIKHALFEDFLNNKLKLSSNEYNSLEELYANPPEYDFYISGSDQIWNPYGKSFNWAYYLPFVKNDGKKIAYAPSMVQKSAEEFDLNTSQNINEYILKFDHLSAREPESAGNINKITGIYPPLVLDPSLLLNVEDWKKQISEKPIIEGDYIFYYTPTDNAEALQIGRELSRKLKLKVVTTIVRTPKIIVKYPDFEKHLTVGPLEFLNLCMHAKLIHGSSLHMVAFAILFNKPFFTTNGLKDKRISHLLNVLHLNDRSITMEDVGEKYKRAFQIDFSDANRILEQKRKESLSYLTNSLK